MKKAIQNVLELSSDFMLKARISNKESTVGLFFIVVRDIGSRGAEKVVMRLIKVIDDDGFLAVEVRQKKKIFIRVVGRIKKHFKI